MNHSQRLWWTQAASDFKAYELMVKSAMPACHAIHYLQMSTEKLAKAYFWKSAIAPSKSHAGVVQFLRRLGTIPQSKQSQLAAALYYRRYVDLQNWIRKSLPIARELERIAPALAGQGENPEYPWPHENPIATPTEHQFAVWRTLTSADGRAFLRQLKFMLDEFMNYAHL